MHSKIKDYLKKDPLAKKNQVVPVVSMSGDFKLSERVSFNNSSGRGRMRSLLIGIDYNGELLGGGHEDVNKMKEFIESQGYSLEEEYCKTLLDDRKRQHPCKQRILDAFKWLVDGATKGDSLFFYYSGHGGQVTDDNGDEEDGKDEAMMPAKCKEGHQGCKGRKNELLIDDEIFEKLVCAVPEGVTLTAIVDSCHSGTVLDLPYSKTAKDAESAALMIARDMAG
eukprot:g19031.t1